MVMHHCNSSISGEIQTLCSHTSLFMIPPCIMYRWRISVVQAMRLGQSVHWKELMLWQMDNLSHSVSRTFWIAQVSIILTYLLW